MYYVWMGCGAVAVIASILLCGSEWGGNCVRERRRDLFSELDVNFVGDGGAFSTSETADDRACAKLFWAAKRACRFQLVNQTPQNLGQKSFG